MQQTPKESSSSGLLFNVLPPKAIGLMVLQIAIVVGALVLGAVSLGRYLDVLWNSRPWMTVVLAFASSVAACFITYRIGMRAVTRTNLEVPLNKPAPPQDGAAFTDEATAKSVTEPASERASDRA